MTIVVKIIKQRYHAVSVLRHALILIFVKSLDKNKVSEYLTPYFCVFIHSGTAYVHGMKHATGNFILIMDADMSHHVSNMFRIGKQNFQQNISSTM